MRQLITTECNGPSAARQLARTRVASLAIALLAALAPYVRAGEESQQAVNDAHRFLAPAARGREVLSYVHFGARYDGHQYLRTVPVNDGNGRRVYGHFALVYRFRWEGDGITDLGYLCDSRGRVYGVQVMYTNAILSQPFFLANTAIKSLGNLLIDAFEEKMNTDERRLVRGLVDDADAKGLLEWSLKFQQTFGA
jgi:hypothetical protein